MPLQGDERVSDLLRKALFVAQSLGLQEFQSWIEQELTGYGESDAAPAYREAKGQIRVLDADGAWKPLIMADPAQQELLSRRRCTQTISEIEHLLETTPDGSELEMRYPEEAQRVLTKGTGLKTAASLFWTESALTRDRCSSYGR